MSRPLTVLCSSLDCLHSYSPTYMHEKKIVNTLAKVTLLITVLLYSRRSGTLEINENAMKSGTHNLVCPTVIPTGFKARHLFNQDT